MTLIRLGGFQNDDMKFFLIFLPFLYHSFSSVHSYGMKIPPPSKTDTPYGGRLIWRLPGGNKLIAHMKDKSKIRHRKRWSQVK